MKHIQPTALLLLLLCILPATSHAAEDSQPLGRIEGILYVGGAPAAEEQVTMTIQDADLSTRSDAHRKAVTDSEGRFAFEDVPPCEVSIGHLVTYRVGTSRWYSPTSTASHTRHVFIEPGRTAHVEIRRPGRRVVGRLVTPPDCNVAIAWRGADARRVYTHVDWPQPPSGLSKEEQQDWREAFRHTEEWKRLKTQMTAIVVDLEEDGAFSVSDVPPGEYSLYIEVGDDEGTGGHADVAGYAGHTFTVLDVGDSAPLDLGDLVVTLHVRLNPGDPAPQFTVPKLGEGQIALADYQGKYVLIDFWATWCAPCREETPILKQVHAKHGADPRFVIVSLSLDSEKDAPAKYIEEEGLDWVQGFLGEWSKTDLPSRYGVRGIPSMFLIDPEGAIRATNLRGPAILDAVEAALGAASEREPE